MADAVGRFGSLGSVPGRKIMKSTTLLGAVTIVPFLLMGCPEPESGPDAGTDARTGPPADAGDAGPSASDAGADAGSDAPPLTTVEARLDHLGIGRTTLTGLGGTVFRDFTGAPVSVHANPLRESVATLAGASELYLLSLIHI